MQILTVVSEGPNVGSSAADLRLVRSDSPVIALGLAVSYLMTKPAFASPPFATHPRRSAQSVACCCMKVGFRRISPVAARVG
jgi:hypothetical protein